MLALRPIPPRVSCLGIKVYHKRALEKELHQGIVDQLMMGAFTLVNFLDIDGARTGWPDGLLERGRGSLFLKAITRNPTALPNLKGLKIELSSAEECELLSGLPMALSMYANM